MVHGDKLIKCETYEKDFSCKENLKSQFILKQENNYMKCDKIFLSNIDIRKELSN